VFGPPVQCGALLLLQVLERVDRRADLRKHLLIEAIERQASRRIAPRKVAVRPAGPVEALAGGDIEDLAVDGEVHSSVVGAVEGLQGFRGESSEDYGLVGGRLEERDWRGVRAEAGVDEVECQG